MPLQLFKDTASSRSLFKDLTNYQLQMTRPAICCGFSALKSKMMFCSLRLSIDWEMTRETGVPFRFAFAAVGTKDGTIQSRQIHCFGSISEVIVWFGFIAYQPLWIIWCLNLYLDIYIYIYIIWFVNTFCWYTQLNDQTVLFLTIQYSISHQT